MVDVPADRAVTVLAEVGQAATEQEAEPLPQQQAGFRGSVLTSEASPVLSLNLAGARMHDDTMLPDDDRDLSLARRIGDQLANNAPLEDAGAPDDPFMAALHDYKRREVETPPNTPSQRLWAAIEQQMEVSAAPPRSARILPLRPAWRWVAVAASVLIMAGLGWLLFASRTPVPVLLASANDDLITYTTADGSSVTLRPHSSLYALPSETGETRVRLLGEAFFAVTHNPSRTFSVEAGHGVVQVLGTRFNVSTWGEQTTVYLEEGSIRLSRLEAQGSVILTPGQQSVLTQDGTLRAPTADAPAEYTDWLRREMTFTERPLRLILAELEHHYAIRLIVPDSLLDDTLSGRILLTEPDQSLTDLALVMGGRFVQVEDELYRFEAE